MQDVLTSPDFSDRSQSREWAGSPVWRLASGDYGWRSRLIAFSKRALASLARLASEPTTRRCTSASSSSVHPSDSLSTAMKSEVASTADSNLIAYSKQASAALAILTALMAAF